VEYEILFFRSAMNGLESLRKFDQKRIRDALVEQLGSQPFTETRNRKKLRPGAPAQWELRVGDYRVFYQPGEEDNQVDVVAIGYKQGSNLTIFDEEYDL
jgi:mRNA-degrading endonuclease RelE of RelBE toxin-antitoxin system